MELLTKQNTSDRIEGVRIILNQPTCNVNHKDFKGYTPILVVKTFDELKLLLEYGADPNAVSESGNTVMRLNICRYGQGFQLLLENGFNVKLFKRD